VLAARVLLGQQIQTVLMGLIQYLVLQLLLHLLVVGVGVVVMVVQVLTELLAGVVEEVARLPGEQETLQVNRLLAVTALLL
jgi:hypothetical protein